MSPSQPNDELDKAIEHWTAQLSVGMRSLQSQVYLNKLLLTAKRSKELEKERDELLKAPLCANHAESFYCNRSTLGDGCILCELSQLRIAYKQALEALEYVNGIVSACNWPGAKQIIKETLSTPSAIATKKGEV